MSHYNYMSSTMVDMSSYVAVTGKPELNLSAVFGLTPQELRYLKVIKNQEKLQNLRSIVMMLVEGYRIYLQKDTDIKEGGFLQNNNQVFQKIWSKVCSNKKYTSNTRRRWNLYLQQTDALHYCSTDENESSKQSVRLR